METANKEKLHFKYTNCKRTLPVLTLEYCPILKCYSIHYYDQNICYDTLAEAQEEMMKLVQSLTIL